MRQNFCAVPNSTAVQRLFQSNSQQQFEFLSCCAIPQYRVIRLYSVPKPTVPGEEIIYRVQAASFRDANDAQQLRAVLLLQNLPVELSSSNVKGQLWHRVVVGPFTQT